MDTYTACNQIKNDRERIHAKWLVIQGLVRKQYGEGALRAYSGWTKRAKKVAKARAESLHKLMVLHG